MTEDQSESDREIERLQDEAGTREQEIARLRDEVAGASDEIEQLGLESQQHHRRERDLRRLVERLRSEARVREDVVNNLLEQLAADELELNDLRAVRDALTPPELPRRDGIELAASFRPASERVSGDFYLVADGPHDATTIVVGDVIGKGLEAARRAAFIRTVFATTAPFSADPAQLLSWGNTALVERAKDAEEFVTAACVAVSPRDRTFSWAYAGHPPVLWLDSGEELGGGRWTPLGLSEEWTSPTGVHRLEPGAGVLLYTDGVTEARHEGEFFGQTRLVQSIEGLGGRSPSEVVAAITAKVQEFAYPGLSDDLCVLAARSEDG